MNRVEEDLTSFFEHSLDLMCIAGFDGYFKRLNPAWEKTLGHSAEDLMSQPYRNFIHPDDYARTLSEAQRISEGANTISFENRYRCKDGRYRWLQWRAHPDTQRGLVFAAARDMTKYKELEQELRSKSALQRAMLDGANYAIISCDSEGTIQDFNAGAQRLLGYTPEEVTNKVSPCIFHDPQEVRRRAEELTIELGRPVRPDFEAFVAKAMLGPPDENEWTYIRKDGTRVPVMLSVTIMRDDQGHALGFLGVASDLTARHKADHARRDLEARLKAILDNTTAIVFLKDREGAYQLVNKRYEELFHLSQEQMTGKSDYDIFPPEYARAFRENDARVLASGQPMILEETAPLDGETRTYVSVKFPVQDEHGHTIALGGISTDITDRKRAEMELREREARLSAILECAVEAIVTIDRAGSIQSFNPAASRIFGFHRGEIIGKPIGMIVPAPDLLAEASPPGEGAGVLASGPAQSRELEGKRKDGTLVPLLVSISQFPTSDGPLYTSIMHDITRRREFEAELRRSNQELEQFAYVASHDLQEPLRMITSYLQLLERRYKPMLNEEAGEFIHTAVDGAARMRTLIMDLLTYSRVGTRGHPLKLVECNRLLDNVLSDLQLAVSESGALVTRKELPVVLADEIQLSQVFQNLITNALKFRSTATPRIHIEAKRSEQDWVFSVRDNGIGINPEFFDRIFIIFQRLHSREEYAGTGIGLALCKRIIERHRGRLWVESSPEKGSAFHFSLPVPIEGRN